MVWHLNEGFSPDEEASLKRWKGRYAERIGKSIDDVTWRQLLLAYANSKVVP